MRRKDSSGAINCQELFAFVANFKSRSRFEFHNCRHLNQNVAGRAIVRAAAAHYFVALAPRVACAIADVPLVDDEKEMCHAKNLAPAQKEVNGKELKDFYCKLPRACYLLRIERAEARSRQILSEPALIPKWGANKKRATFGVARFLLSRNLLREPDARHHFPPVAAGKDRDAAIAARFGHCLARIEGASRGEKLLRALEIGSARVHFSEGVGEFVHGDKIAEGIRESTEK